MVAQDRLLDPVFIAAGTSDQWYVRPTQSFRGIVLICWSESQQFERPPAVCIGPSAAQWKLKSALPAGVSLSISVNYISAMPGGEDAEIDARVVKVMLQSAAGPSHARFLPVACLCMSVQHATHI